jgi:hypothetical protein
MDVGRGSKTVGAEGNFGVNELVMNEAGELSINLHDHASLSESTTQRGTKE